MNSIITEAPPLLDSAIGFTKQTEPEHAQSLLQVFTENALNGTILWQKNFVATMNSTIDKIDALISEQLQEIMHQPEFTQLEGSWRGLDHLIKSTETSSELKIKVLNVSKSELQQDFDSSIEFDQSELFKKVYEAEFGMPGGEPYGVLIGDYQFSQHPEDLSTLKSLSEVASMAFCPFVAAAAPELLGLDSWTELSQPRDLGKIFDTKAFVKWQAFRKHDYARFVNLTLPRALARLPYGEENLSTPEFNYEETITSPEDHCWMNASYLLGTCITQAFAKTSWVSAIRGAENGGKVSDLPLYCFPGDDGEIDMQCPTEIAISDRREAELSRLGFLPLCHYKNTDHAVFFGAQSLQKVGRYNQAQAQANAEISSRLPYVLSSARFAHYLKVIARDKVGSFMQASDCEDWLNKWILQYVNNNAASDANLKAKYPLAEAQVKVTELASQPGVYNATVWLRPWLQMEELNASLRLVTSLPKKA